MDNEDCMRAVANSTASTLVKFFSDSSNCDLKSINEFCSRVASHCAGVHDELRKDYLTGLKGSTPASPYLSKTRVVYEYIRERLSVKMHGLENYNGFMNGLGVDAASIGENISIIYEVRVFHRLW
jgi:phenylalanine ammonia-lyase